MERVANGRGMTYEHAHSLAKGRVSQCFSIHSFIHFRSSAVAVAIINTSALLLSSFFQVWTGADAKAIGLVDELGGVCKATIKANMPLLYNLLTF